MFFYQTINYLQIFFSNIFKYSNLILTSSIDYNNEIEAYKIFSNLPVYNHEIILENFKKYHFITKEDGTIIFILLDSILNSKNFQSELPIESFSFIGNGNNSFIDIIKKTKIIFIPEKFLFGIEIKEKSEKNIINFFKNMKPGDSLLFFHSDTPFY